MTDPEPNSSPRSSSELPRRIAHALRTPLGLVATALQELDASKGEDPLLRLGHRGVRQLAHLADRLSLLGRISDAAEAPARAPVGLADVVELAASDVAEIRPRRRVETTVERPPEPLRVLADGSWLRAALVELVDNATRFARRAVAIEVRAEDQRAVVTIRDDGPGIRGEGEPDRGSVGIGLVLARALCAPQAITLELGPAEGGGTLATLTLERAPS